MKPKVSRRKEIIEIRADIKRIENSKKKEKKLMKQRSFFSEEITKIHKPLSA